MKIEKPINYDPSEFYCSTSSVNCPESDKALWSPDQMMNYGKLPNDKIMINWPIYGNDYYSNLLEMNEAQRKVVFKKARIAGAFHGALSLTKQKKIPKVLKLLEFPCFDALSYSHLAEGKIDIVLQCGNKIWDIHPLIPIIEAAGGKVSTWTGDEAKKGGNIIVANNEKNKKQMIKLLKPAS